jgi:hypothetical protein
MSLLLTATKLRLVDRATTHVPRPLNLLSLPLPYTRRIVRSNIRSIACTLARLSQKHSPR